MKKLKKIVKSDFFKNILVYTVIFIALSLLMISIFSKYDIWFIWTVDGIKMHTINLEHLREIIIKFIRTGNLSFFTWKLGNGLDLFSNFSYFIFGDFFSYFSILGRTRDVALVYNILVFLRIYCVGISFLCYTKYHKLNNVASIIGALLFTFSSYVLYASAKHPYFTNALIVFPLLMLGIEKIIKDDKKIFYTIIIAIACVVNFYFAYPMFLTLAIYGTIIAIKYYKKDGIKKIIQVLFKTLFYSLLGIMISSFVLFPTVISLFNCQRFSGNIISSYSLAYYRKLLYSVIHLKNAGYWVVIGTQSLIFISLPLMIYRGRKEIGQLLILLLILLLPILSVHFGSVFMFFGYPNNRWSFIFPFLFSAISATFLSKEYQLNKKDLFIVFITLGIFLLVNVVFENTLSIYFVIQIILLFVWILILYNQNYLKTKLKKINLYYISLLLLTTIGIGTSIKFIYDINGSGYVSEFANKSNYNKIVNTATNTIPDFINALDFIKEYDNGFYKNPNISLIKNFNSTSSFMSILPTNYSDLNSDLNNSKFGLVTGFNEFDYRTKINTLLGVKYFIDYKGAIVPYGYKKVENYDGKSDIYENEYYLPFANLYTNYITEKEYNNLSSLEKESSLLKTTILENKSNLNHAKIDYSDIVKEVEFNIVDNNNILKDDSIVITNSNKNSISLEFENVTNSELYVSLSNLKYIPFNKEEMINLQINEKSSEIAIAQAKRKYKWYEPDASYVISAKYNSAVSKRSEKDYFTATYRENLSETLLNLGYYNQASGTIKITLSKIGNYTFDDIKVYALSMDGYEDDINNLRKSNFEVNDYDDGYLDGTVNATESGILQFQTMYNNGWKVYVDDKEVETLKSNKYFLGINIEKGKHKIHMEYHTPYLKEGMILSIVGICIFTTIIVFENKKRKIKKH